MSEKLKVAMPVDSVLAWFDEEIADLTKTVAKQPESIKAVVGFTIDHLIYMKATLIKNVEDMQKKQAENQAAWDKTGD